MMKKFLTGLFLVVFTFLMLNITKADNTPESQLPANCIAYNDGCNTCGKAENGQWACTLMACVDQKEPTYTCTAYADTGSNDPVACTMQYAPVCASVQVQCIRAPCPAVHETFGNACMMNANPQATFLYNGECVADNKAIGEGELTSGPVSPEFQTNCKDGLLGIYAYAGDSHMVGGGMVCYDPKKSEPVCKIVNSLEGRYYADNTLLRAMDCNKSLEVACTKEYRPVCGVHADGSKQTYGNMCMLKADNARVLYTSECKVGLNAGEGYIYGSIANILDQSYLTWKYTPIQAYNYTQSIIDKIDHTLMVSRMKKPFYDKYLQIKRLLQTYMGVMNITQ